MRCKQVYYYNNFFQTNLVFTAGYKNKDQQLIELQDSGARKQIQMQDEADLQALQEQEQSIRQLEVMTLVYFRI